MLSSDFFYSHSSNDCRPGLGPVTHLLRPEYKMLVCIFGEEEYLMISSAAPSFIRRKASICVVYGMSQFQFQVKNTNYYQYLYNHSNK